MFNITDPSQFPAATRLAPLYPYLNNEFFSLWLDGLNVAHQLLERHQAAHGNSTYYQDNFGLDYIAALDNPQFGDGAGIVFDCVADPALSDLHRNDHPDWQAFKQAREDLKSAPRGTIALLNAEDRWHIRIHCGGGYVSDCKTMRSTGPKPTVREIQECVLKTEAYLARKQAEKEQQYINSFARLRELHLQPGMTVQDVILPYNGKGCSMVFRVESISKTGSVSLIDGRLRGSPKRFTATIPACDITHEQVRAIPPKKAAFAAMTATTQRS